MELKTKKNCLLTLMVIALLCNLPAGAQVTIGSDTPITDFSILELISNNKGLRLTQIESTAERNSMIPSGEESIARGLVVFNKETGCVEYWNGTRWVSLCASKLVDCNTIKFPVMGTNFTLCNGSTVANLATSAGCNVQLYENIGDINPIVALTNNTTKTYYAEQIVSGCKSERFAVEVTLGDCTSAPSNGNVTAFTNVMYDFQHQTLEAYWSGGIPTGYKWQVGTPSSGAFSDIPGAPNSKFFTIPAYYATNLNGGTPNTDSLFFRCKLSNTIGEMITPNSFNILFIRTDSPGYGGIGTETPYLTIKKGNSGSIKIALLSLGASEDNDAGDLGDLYQWGRVKDGHEKIVWSKNSSHANTFTSGVNGTSAPVAKGSPTYTSSGQISDVTHNGKFIIFSSGDWGEGNTTSNARWGNGSTNSTRVSDIPLSSWTYPENNPCPSGWGVPSRWNFWDIYRGTGSDISPTNSNYTGTVNGWYWRGTTNGAIGGAIIKIASGERVFLPAAGYRHGGDDLLLGTSSGYYWSSMNGGGTTAFYMNFGSGFVGAGVGHDLRPGGFSVRCVAE